MDEVRLNLSDIKVSYSMSWDNLTDGKVTASRGYIGRREIDLKYFPEETQRAIINLIKNAEDSLEKLHAEGG